MFVISTVVVPNHISRETELDIKRLVHEVDTEFNVAGDDEAAER